MNTTSNDNPTVSEKLALEIHTESIIENLIAFHNKTRPTVENEVKALHLENKPIILKADPYLLAWELVHGVGNHPTKQKFNQDKYIAGKIFESVQRRLMYKR
jgi:hypothetical protein